MIIKNEAGEDIEVYTAEEIEQHKSDAIEAFKAENPDKSGELANLQEKMREAEEKLAKVGDKDYNFKALEKAKNDAEGKLKEFTSTIDEKINSVKREVLEGVMSAHKSDALASLVGDDEELKKKVELEYGRLSDVASTKEQISKKLKDAYVLATAKDPDGVNASIYGSGNVGRVSIKSTSPKFSNEEKELGAKFGLNDKDFK